MVMEEPDVVWLPEPTELPAPLRLFCSCLFFVSDRLPDWVLPAAAEPALTPLGEDSCVPVFVEALFRVPLTELLESRDPAVRDPERGAFRDREPVPVLVEEVPVRVDDPAVLMLEVPEFRVTADILPVAATEPEDRGTAVVFPDPEPAVWELPEAVRLI